MEHKAVNNSFTYTKCPEMQGTVLDSQGSGSIKACIRYGSCHDRINPLSTDPIHA